MNKRKKNVLNVKIRVEKSSKALRKDQSTRPLRKHVHALFRVATKYIKKKKQFVFSDNISMGGVFLETFDPLPIGTRVTLRFPLKSALRPIQIEGRVVWNRPEIAEGKLGNKSSGMAVAFMSVKDVDRKFLKEFLDNTLSYGWYLE